MSLQVWLPLNGSLENKGLSPAKFSLITTGGGISSAASGKTSLNCYARTTKNTISHITSDINFSLNGDVSMACWCKLTDFGTNNSANGIITQHGHNTGGLGITMKYINASDYRMSINTGTKGDSFPAAERDRTYMTYYGGTNIYNDWHHLCVTYCAASRQVKMYVDGNLETIQGYGTSVTLNGNNTTPRPFRLFDWSTDHSSNASYRPPCSLNDVRLYDHCLSPREVKLLSQGLVAHYKMSGIHLDNLIPGVGFSGTNSWTGGTIDWSVTADGDVASLRLDKGTSVASTPIEVQPILGHKYYGRELIKTNGNVNATDCRFELYAGDGQGLNWVFGYNSGNYPNWTINSGIITIDQLKGSNYVIRTFVVNSTNNVWIDDVILIDLTTAFGKGNEPSKEWCDQNIPQHYGFGVYNLIPNTKDSSGHSNNLDIGRQLIGGTSIAGHALLENCLNADSIKYRNCTKFNVLSDRFFTYNTRYDTLPDSITNGTISSWVKLDAYPSSNMVIFADFHSKIAFGFWGEQNAIMCCSNNDIGTKTITNLKSKWDINKWHHIAVTRNNNTFTFYLDGQEWSTIGGAYDNTTNYWTHNYNGLTLGARYNAENHISPAEFEFPFSGSLSDVRLYVTPLSPLSIKELYQSSISFLDNGTLQISETVEEAPTNLKFKENGIVQAQAFSEFPYHPKLKVKMLPDGSKWVRINWLDINAATDPNNIFFNSSDVDYCINESNRFSLMKYINDFDSKTKVYVTNLLPDISSSNYSTTGSLLNSTVTGNKNSSETYLTPKNSFYYEKNHKYYVRSEVKSYTDGCTHDFYIMAVDERGACFTGIQCPKDVSVTTSTIYQSSAFESQQAKVRLDFNNNYTNNKMFFADAIIIDLTKDFGAGNEPSKEWCDEHIYDFTGSRILSVGKGDPIGNPTYEFMLTYPVFTELEYIEADGRQILGTGISTRSYTQLGISAIAGHQWKFDIQFTKSDARQLM